MFTPPEEKRFTAVELYSLALCRVPFGRRGLRAV